MKTCILIQTCDKYEFLWEGLNLAWEENWDWENLSLDAFVLTEDKHFIEHSRFKTIYGGSSGQGASNFSTRLIAALKLLKDMGYDSIFYSQDDFWPLFPVNTRIFKRAFDLFEARMDCLHINEYCPWYEYTLIETLVKDLWKFQKGSRFYFNHQAAIWNIDSLLRIQNPDEEPYENECKGTERAWELNSEHYLLNYAWYKAAYINDKGTLLPIAQDFVRDWKWKRYINTLKNINESTRDSFN